MKTESGRKEIVAVPVSGLANRLIALACCMRAADLLDRDIDLVWEMVPACDCPVSRLFDSFPSAKETTRLGEGLRFLADRTSRVRAYCSDEWLARDPARLGLDVVVQTRQPITFGKDGDNDAQTIVVISPTWVLLEGETVGGPDGLTRQLPEYLKRLRPAPGIVRRVEDFIDETGFDRDVIGVHIRRTDKAAAMERLGKLPSSDEFFALEMRKRLSSDPAARFFLATDSQETRDKFQREFKNQVLVAPVRQWVTRIDESTDSYYRNLYRSAASVEDALVDLLLLSKTGVLIGSRGSTFSLVARLWGVNQLVLEQ